MESIDKLQIGIDEYLSGDLNGAIKSFREYIDEGGYDIGSAYYHIGLCYSDLNQTSLACENFMKAVEISPTKSMYLYKLGLSYFRLMALDKAADSLKKTIEINKEHQRARFLLGQVYFQKGDMALAEDIFSEVLEKSPDFPEAYYYRALCKYYLSKVDNALDDLNKAVEINENYIDALFFIGRINFEKANYKEAVAVCEKVYNKGHRNFSFIKFYLSSLLKAGKTEEFNDLKIEADLLFPNNIDIENIN